MIAGPTHTGGVEEFVHPLVGRDLPWDEVQRRFVRGHRPAPLLQRRAARRRGYVDAILP
ncbi:hypothetical protein [Geodermatophilus sp. SYSU D01036]